MAFQVSDIKISGTIDDLSFYNSVFGWLVRRKGGPTRKQFKNAPNFARSRENSNEFTRCPQAASAIRKLIIKHTNIKHKTLYHRLIKLMRLLANADETSPRGYRDPLKGMQSTQGISLLKNFEISPGLSLYSVLVSAGLIQLKHTVTEPTEIKSYSSNKKLRRKRKFYFVSRNRIALSYTVPELPARRLVRVEGTLKSKLKPKTNTEMVSGYVQRRRCE
jgi:hypothetical protein